MIWAAVKKAAPEQDHIESHGVGLMFRKALRSVKKSLGDRQYAWKLT